jgi:hypothetical protein
MLLDFSHERWAAKRSVSPELWRPIAPFVDDSVLSDLRKVLETSSLLEQQAATLTLLASGHPKTSESLDRYGDLSYDATHRKFDWSTLAQQWLNSQRG